MPPRSSRIHAAVLVAALVLTAPTLDAQAARVPGPADSATAHRAIGRLDSLLARSVRTAFISTQDLTRQALRGQPGSTAGSSGAFGAGWGDVFFGGGYQARTRYTTINDGAVSAGFGLGDPRQYVGLEVALTSASTFRQGFGTNGGVSLKVHRVLPRSYGVAVGFENVASWGGTDGGSSVYGVVSNNFKLRDDASAFLGSLAWNVGVGNNRYLLESTLDSGRTGVNVFASGGLRLHEQAALVLDWTGQDLTSVVSFVPVRSLPVVVSAGFADLTGTAGDGARFIIGAGMGFRVRDVLGIGSRSGADRNRR